MTDKEVPERIWYSPEWNICHKTKQSYNPKADITFGVEYIRKDSFVEIHKIHCEQMQAIRQNERQEAVKHIGKVYIKWEEDIRHLDLSVLEKELLQAIKKDLGVE